MSDSTKPEETPRDDELDEKELDQVSGGRLRLPDVAKTPTPGGPVPVPYPNSN
jgi:bacteriocin-like protein